MSFDPNLVYLLGGVPLVIPLFRLFFSRNIISTFYFAFSIFALGLCLSVVWQTPWRDVATPLVWRLSFPILFLPKTFSVPPATALIFCKGLLLYVFCFYRKEPSGLCWAAMDGALTLLLFSADLLSFLTYWQILVLAATFWIARKSDGATDVDSEYLLRLAGLSALGFGLFYAGLALQDSQTVVVATLLLSAGVMFQARQVSRPRLRRQMFLAAFIAFCIPVALLQSRLPLTEIADAWLAVPVCILLSAGIFSAASRTVDWTLPLAVIALHSLGTIAAILKTPISPMYWASLLAPIGVLLTLLATQPAFLKSDQSNWIRSLGFAPHRLAACLSLLALIPLLGMLPLGGSGFPLRKLLETSAFVPLLVCVGTVTLLVGIFGILSGAWFADRFWKWPRYHAPQIKKRYSHA